jgi:Do/DeqQ family serine protease
MLAKVSPAVVNISVQGTLDVPENPLFQDPLFKKFFGFPDNLTPDNGPHERFRAVGSGVIYDARQGYVITNYHVVKHADKILVILNDRRQLQARLVAVDAQTDIAILKLRSDNLTALPVGDSNKLSVGDYVVALGDPFGVGQTATFGIVSALGRNGLGIEGYEDFIQTDAAINPGNSGGALVDMSGHLIGINTAILSRSGGNVGIGFAIPIDLVKSVADQLIAHGRVTRGELGVAIQDLTFTLAQAMGLKASIGALVSQVRPDSAAANSGIREGDVITAVNGHTVADVAQLRNEISQKQPGSTVRLTLLRNGKEIAVTATLRAVVASTDATTPNLRSEAPLLGLTIGPIPASDPHNGKLKGVYVIAVDPQSAASDAGIKAGDIIIGAGQVAVAAPSDLLRILRERNRALPLLLQVRRGDLNFFVAIG